MITRRLIVLTFVVVAGMSLVHFIPKIDNAQPSGVVLDLPSLIGDWFGREQPILEKERNALGAETEFARKLYTNSHGDELFVSIVLAGRDMNTSIHRPERCLPAQGWTIADSRTVTVPLENQPLKVTRLHDMRAVPTKEGSNIAVYSLNYYWFVGSHDTTPSHLERNFFDVRDRLLHGANQRWAYVTVVSTITKGLIKYGRDEKQTDELIQDFIRELYPAIHKPA